MSGYRRAGIWDWEEFVGCDADDGTALELPSRPFKPMDGLRVDEILRTPHPLEFKLDVRIDEKKNEATVKISRLSREQTSSFVFGSDTDQSDLLLLILETVQEQLEDQAKLIAADFFEEFKKLIAVTDVK